MEVNSAQSTLGQSQTASDNPGDLTIPDAPPQPPTPSGFTVFQTGANPVSDLALPDAPQSSGLAEPPVDRPVDIGVPDAPLPTQPTGAKSSRGPVF